MGTPRSRRRYFRRRKAKAKVEEGRPAQPKPRPKARGRRRRGERRRPRRRHPEILDIPESFEILPPAQEEEPDQVVTAYVYTTVLRPIYRDALGDYRSEHSLGEGRYETSHARIMAQVTEEIHSRVEAHFDQVESEGDTWKRPLTSSRPEGSDGDGSVADN